MFNFLKRTPKKLDTQETANKKLFGDSYAAQASGRVINDDVNPLEMSNVTCGMYWDRKKKKYIYTARAN